MTTEEQWYKDKFLLYWYDNARTIFVIDYKNSYRWSDYYMIMPIVGRMVKNIPHPIVYLHVWDEKSIPLFTTNPLPHYRVINRVFNPQAIVFVIPSVNHTNVIRRYCNIMEFKENETYWIASNFDEGVQIAQAHAAKPDNQGMDACTS